MDYFCTLFLLVPCVVVVKRFRKIILIRDLEQRLEFSWCSIKDTSHLLKTISSSMI